MLTSDLYKALDNSIPTLCIFIDLAKAFDTICHSKLLKKLEKIGFRGTSQKLMESYLKNREQRVEIDGVMSDSATTEYGIPQGTVLGPILFNIYINDLLKLPSEGKIVSFADDTVIMYTESTWAKVKAKAEKDFATFKKWFDTNVLTINCNKTKYLPFTSYQIHLPNLGPFAIDSGDNNIMLIEEAESALNMPWNCT